MQAGDTVLVHDGTYVGFQIETSGTASDPIVFRALSLNVVVNEENPVRGQHNINVEGANYVVIEGFRVRDAAVAGIRVASARGVVVRDNVAGPNGRWGIFTGFAPEVQILDNVTFGSVSQHGIYVSNSNVPDDNPVIQGNESYGNGQNGIQLNGDCHANGDGDGVIEGALVENNVVHDNTNKGLSIISAPEARIQNNVIYDNGIEGAAGGIHLVDEPDCGLPTNDAVVVNNTVVEPRIAGIRMNLGASGNVVFNNLIVSSNPIADEEGTNLVDPVSNLTRSSTAGLFVDADAHDYRLTPGSPALDAGTPSYQGRSAPGVDIDEVPRPVGPAFDAGAYEGPTPVAAEDLPPSSGPMLHPNAPNPFRSKTTIRYTGPRADPVTLQMFDDARGREVATPVEAVQPAGPHVVVHSTHGMNIPASHPRLFWNSTRLAAAQAWLTAHPFTASTDLDIAFKSYVSGTSCATAVNNATSYLVPYNQWNPSAIGSDAYRGTAEPFLLVFDWRYSSFSATSPGTTTLSTSVTPGQAKSLTVGSTTGMFVGEVLTLGSAGAENVIVDQVTNSTTVRVQNIVSSHTNGTTITLLSQRDSFIQKFTIWAQGIQQQSWGGTQNGGMKMSNYYWGNMRNEFEIGVITYGDNGSGPGSAPDNLIDNALVNRWTNQIVANAGANGSLSGGIPQEGMEYGAAQFQYMIIPFFSAKDMGRDLILETPFMKQLLYWALYSTTPSKTLIKDVTPNITEYFISTWSDDEITASGGGILWARAYIEDGMDTMAQLFATNSPSTNLGPYARQYLNTLGISIPLNLDPYATGTRAYYVSNFLQAADPGGSAGSYSSLPLDYYATGYQAGIWKKAWDTSSSFVFYQFSKPADSVVGHAHSDFGNFDIWRNGRYLSRKTINYNNIIAGEPNINANANQSDVVSSLQNNVIAFTNVALGQDSNPSYTMPSIRLGDPVVTRLESNADYGYVASDLTNVYKWDAGHSSFDTGVVGSVVREMIYIRSLETLVVFDRVVTANQTHGGSLTAAQVVTSALHHYEVAPVQDGGASDYKHWTSTNGTQVLRQTVLIPAGLTASNARLIDEASCAGCDAVGQMRLDIDNSGVATRYHLSVLQARDTSGTNHAVGFTDSNSGDPTLGTFTITTTPSGGSATTIVFNKGASSSGGTIAVAGGSTQSPRSDVQGITYTDNGPVWSIPVTPSVSFQGAKVQ